jgi:hypothetical protein
MLNIIRNILTALGLGAILNTMLKNWLQGHDYLEHPETAIIAILSSIASLTATSWFYPALAVTISTAAILWFISLYLRYAHYRLLALEEIGDEMLQAARRMANRQGGFRNDWPANIADIQASLVTLCARIRSFRIYAPGEEEFQRPDRFRAIHKYFDFVGSFLSKSLIKEAKRRALEVKAKLEA